MAGALTAGLGLLAGCAAPIDPEPKFSAGPVAIGEDAIRASDGTLLPMRSWLPAGRPGAVVLALHGFGDYSAAFRQPAMFWAAHGVATFAYDQRGFGGAPHTHYWAGADVMAADAKAAVRELRRRYPGIPLYLLGESMGGAVALVATTGADPAEVDGAILVSPAVWAHDLAGAIERSALWLTKMAAPGLWLEAPRGLDIHPSDNIDMLRALGRDSLVQLGARADTTAGLMDLMDRAGAAADRIRLPTLVLFGAHEEILPKDAVAGFIDGLPDRNMRSDPNVRIAVYPNGYHMLLRDLHGEIVWRDILAWIADRSARLPSGDECAARTAGLAGMGAPGGKPPSPAFTEYCTVKSRRDQS